MLLWLTAAGGVSEAATYSARLHWSASSGGAAAGYRLYVRATGGSYGAPLDIGMPVPSGDGSLTADIPDLDTRIDHMLAVTAYGSDGTESSRSNELPLAYAQVAQIVDSDDDGLTDAQEDRNLNRTVDAGETSPFNPDSDGDGVLDGNDACQGTAAGDPAGPDGCSCAQRSCGDGNACTTDSCVAGRCQYTVVGDGVSCSDGNACNGAETCQAGACRAGSPLNCDDGNSCTTDACSAGSGCTHTAIANCVACTTAEQCDDGNPCTAQACASGHCQYVTVGNGTACSDGNECNGAETCQAGTCRAGTPPTCDDGSACTIDACTPGVGCTHAVIAGCTPCTASIQCNDNDACTTDTCTAGRCQHGAAANGISCSDGNACNGGETCQGGVCTAGTAPSCDDGNPCTTDVCSLASGCTHATIIGCTGCTNASQCNDGNLCTADTCVAGQCQHAVALDGSSCSDGRACNGDETCRSGVCVAGQAASCDDGNACTTDTCAPSGQCVHEGIADCCLSDADCQDTDVCTLNEHCDLGRCVSEPLACAGDGCLAGACDPTLGCSTTPVPDGTPCLGDDPCGGEGICQAGACQPPAAARAASGLADFQVTRFLLRPAGKKTFDIVAEGVVQVPALAILAQDGIEIELHDAEGAVLYLASIPGVMMRPGKSDFTYFRPRGLAAVPGLRKLQFKLKSAGVEIAARVSVPRTGVLAVQTGALEKLMASQTLNERRLTWVVRMGGKGCSRDTDLTCLATRSSTQRCL